ncbi:CBS domain-containing protein [Nakamurella panacisegetis]|uniref:CBS domain-containing protein n=2 Tax=Nakamurella panacisegetis TaxID=1090615 RepID=A0A1H0SY30_9ACTN|nr:CBS domain-containing protein [Nakamurella panacisegetis]
MTRNVVTVRPHTPLAEAASILVRRGFSALPVVDAHGGLVGVITEADVVGSRFDDGTPAPDPAEPAARKVSEVMTSPVVGVSDDADLSLVARAMLQGHRRSMPIVDGTRLVGVVTRRDILRMLTRSDAQIADDVRAHLRVLGGRGRWTVQVVNGDVSVWDQFNQESDREVAKVLAEGVPGAIRVSILDGHPQGGDQMP